MTRRNDQQCPCGHNTNTTTELLAEQTQTLSTDTDTTAARNCGCDNNDETVSSGRFCIESCTDFASKNIGTISMNGVGQVINASVTLSNVCPNRTIALGVTLAEVDECGCETNIAFKSFEITTPRCGGKNIRVTDINFVVPRNGSNNRRCFRLHATANYLDTNVCI